MGREGVPAPMPSVPPTTRTFLPLRSSSFVFSMQRAWYLDRGKKRPDSIYFTDLRIDDVNFSKGDCRSSHEIITRKGNARRLRLQSQTLKRRQSRSQ